MRDLKYHALQIDRPFAGIALTLVSPAIRQPSAAYEENMDRMVALAGMPARLVYWSMLLQLQTCSDSFRYTNKLLCDNENPEDAQFSEVISKDIERQMVQRIESFRLDAERLERKLWDLGSSNVAAMNHHLGNHIAHGLEAVYSAVVIGTWTAFETLAGDLWEACLNVRPRLGFVALDAEVIPSDDESTVERKKKTKYPIPIRLLRKWDYDLKGRMGSLLRGKWDFARRNEAADAYAKVFGKGNARLASIFEDQRLRWLVAMRNALVHKGGLADSEFVALVSRHPSLGTVEEGERILLDGELVKGLVDPVAKRSVELIQFVDEWLSANEE